MKGFFQKREGIILPLVIIVTAAVLLAMGGFAAFKIIHRTQTSQEKEATSAAQFGDIFPSQSPSHQAQSEQSKTSSGTQTTPTLKPTAKPTSTPTPTPVPKSPTCSAPNVSPSTTGRVPFLVHFSGRGTNGSSPIVGYHWDYNADGAWDTEYAASDLIYQFNDQGTFEIRSQAKDSAGRTSGICSVTVTAQPPFVANIVGYVFSDDNCNGNRDPGEAGISGRQVDLLKLPEWSTIASGTTNSSGYYSIELSSPSGEYKTNSVAPSGYKSVPSYSYPSFMVSGSTTIQSDIPFVPGSGLGYCF
jgi:hypothetical protein